MPIDETKLANLLEISRTAKPQVCEILKVEWSDTVIKYYAASQFDQLNPYRPVANYLLNSEDEKVPIEVRFPEESGIGFHAFELNADLSTEEISLTFIDTDGDIKTKFQTYGEGVRCELFYYYPQVIGADGLAGLFTSVWWGHLLKPQIVGRGKQTVTAVNGFKSRELKLPRRSRPEFCTQVFGAHLTDKDEFRGNGCVYNLGLPGGTVGNLDPLTGEPFTSCKKTESECVARLGAHGNGKPKYHMGFETLVSPVVTDAGTGYLAVSRGNSSRLREPIRVIFGSKQVRELPNLFYRKELPDWIRGVWEVGEEVGQLGTVLINDAFVSIIHLDTRRGGFSQTPLSYAGDMRGFSGTALVQAAAKFPGQAATTEKESIRILVTVPQGYNKIRIYSDEDTFTTGWTNNRVWCLLECYTNLRFGRGYRHNKFHIEDFITAADWLNESIRFVQTHEDASTTNFDHRRDVFDAILDGRPAQEQIVNICRTARISVPFQYESKYSIAPLSKCEDLEACRVFSDKGTNKNIVWDEAKQSIKCTQIPDSQLPNKVLINYEDATQWDKAVPLTFDDTEQKLKAGLALGDSSFFDIEKQFSAFGIRNRTQAIKYGFSLLHLGEFDEGGIKNNLRLEFTVFFEQALGLKKFEVIKVESDLLVGYGFDYFRVQKMRKSSNHLVTITAQAYPQSYYETFETDISPVAAEPYFPAVNNLSESAIDTVSFTDGVLSITTT